MNNELDDEIKRITGKLKNFIVENSHVTEVSLTNVEISRWRPILLDAKCTAVLELKYVQGKVDRNSYARAMQDYENKYQSYLMAHNQYVQAVNQFESISNREKDLEWHKRTRLSYPIKPTEPTEPSESQFVTWNEKLVKENYPVILNEKFLLNQDDSRFKYLEYISTKSKERSTHGNFVHKTNVGTSNNYSDILKESIPDTFVSDDDQSIIDKEIDRGLERKFYTIANNYMTQWYFKNLSIERINYEKKELQINFANIYVGTYKYSGKFYKIAVDLTNNVINGELPSAIGQIGKFIFSHCLVLLCLFVLNFILFYFFWEGYSITILGNILLSYLGFMAIVYSNFFDKLNFFKVINSGLSKRLISMDLNNY